MRIQAILATLFAFFTFVFGQEVTHESSMVTITRTLVHYNETVTSYYATGTGTGNAWAHQTGVPTTVVAPTLSASRQASPTAAATVINGANNQQFNLALAALLGAAVVAVGSV